MSQALYDAVKSGRVKLDSLNSDGIDALRNYMDDKVTPGGSIDSIQSDQRKTEQTAAFNPQPFNNDPVEAQPVEQNKSNFLDKIFKDNPIVRGIGKGLNTIDVLSQDIAKFTAPDAPMFTKDGKLDPNMTARQQYLINNPQKSTGSAGLDNTLDYGGQVGSLFVPIGTGGALVNDAGKISSGLLGTKAGQWLDNTAGKAGANAANVANPLLNQAGINLSTDLAQKAGQGLLRGGALGAAYGAVQPLATGSGQLSDVPQSMLENAAMFGGGDALLPFAGAGIGKIGELLKKDAPLPDYSNVSLSQGKGMDNPIKPADAGLNIPEQILNSSAKFQYSPDELSVIKSHVDNPYVDINKVEIPKEYQGKDILYRRDNADMNLSDKPHGAYFSYLNDGKNVYTSHFDAGGTDHWFTPNFKNTLDVKPSMVETNARAGTKKLETSAGVQAALDLSENPDILHYSKDNLEILIKDLDPSLNLSKYHDNWELLEVYGAQLAKEHGYDSIALRVPDDPASSEVVALKNDAFKPINNNGKPLNSDAKPNEPIKLTPVEIARNERIDKFSKIEDNPIIPNTADQIQSKTGKDSTSFSTKANQAYINTVDNLHRTNQFDQAAKKANGSILNPSDSAYTLSLNARGHDMQASQIVNKNMINAQGEVTGQSLADITKQIPKGQEQAFKDYVVAQHAIDRMGRGEQVYADEKNMTIQKAKEIVDQYNGTNPEFKNIQQQYTKFHQDFAQQWYVDTGLFKQEQINKAFEDNPNYVPNKRIFSDIEKKTPFGNSKGGAVGQSNPVKRYGEAGSKRPIVDPIESSIEDVAKGVKTAKNNEAGQAIVRSLQRNPEELAGFARIVGKDTELNVDEMIQKDGIESVIDHINKTFEDATRNHNPEKGNIVTVLEHGEPIKIEVYDPQFLEAISNLSPKGQDYVTAAVGKGTKVMKTLTTGVNPVFGLTRNISRDIPHAFVSSKTTNNPVRFGVDLLDAVTSVLADSVSHSKLTPDFMKGWLETRGSLYNDYKNMGGGHSSPIAADRNLLAQSKENILPTKGIKQVLKRPFTKAYHVLENVNNAAEAAPRLGEYKRTIQQGLDQGKGLYDSKVKALYEANDVTTNFNKFGNVTKNADAYLPYLNAAVQGLDQLVRMGTQGGAKRLTAVYGKAIGALTIPTTVLYLINHNNPDYQQVSNFIKDNYLLIPNGDGTFKKIAKPRELGMVFSTGVERALRAFADHDPRAFQDFGTAFLKNFLPPGAGGAVDGFNQKGLAGIPGGALQDTIAGPLMDLERNKNFANQPIVPQDLLNLSPKNQYDAKTSEPAKFFGNLLNSSPKQLDFLAKSYLGVIGQLGIPATTKGGSIGDTLKQQVNVDPVYSNDISSNFYNQKNKEDMAKADAKFNGVPQQDMSAYYDKLATQFSKVRNQMKMIQKDDTLSNTDKQSKLKDLQVNLNQIQKNATK